MKPETKNGEQLPETVQPGETLPAVQLCPFGNFPGEKSMQVCDRAAFEQLIADWRANGAKEILMDFEHQSEVERIDSDTRAAAWISNLAIDDERGLVGDVKFTDQGAEAVSNRRLRFLSCTWYTDKQGRPMKMTTVALTNKPNIPVAPILNKVKVEGEGEASTVHLHLNPSPNKQKGSEMDIEKLKQALGLPAEATEEQVLAAIKEGQDAKAKAAELQAKAEKAALEKEADEFAEANAKKCNKDVLKAQYIANKDVAKALVAGIPDAPDVQRVLNKQTAKTPSAREEVVLQRNKAVAEYRTPHKCDFNTAWCACRSQNPELFAD